jgi:hypothetical protein
MPGPPLVATIREIYLHDAPMGPLVTLGHGLIEFAFAVWSYRLIGSHEKMCCHHTVAALSLRLGDKAVDLAR